jgi:2-polyprenyl-6-methoxyphenol hydroxylase-like FAD-dependent oxidoreductase
VIHRALVIKTLYENMTDGLKARCHLNKTVSDIQHTEDGVEVLCSDGTSFKGDMVLGADGSNSKVRKIMRRLALLDDPNAQWDAEEVYSCEYKSIWFSVPGRHDDIAPGQLYETQNTNNSVMYMQGRNQGWAFLFEKLPKPTTACVRYTEKDMAELAERMAEYPVTEKFKVKDIFANRAAAGMGNLQEGMANNWSWGRIALIGDACHKFTPNAGLGFNNGVQDIVALCNGLREVVAGKPKPDMSTLSHVFETYKANRQELLHADATTSANVTRMQAWQTFFFYLMARFIMSINPLQVWLLNVFSTPLVRRSLVFDYIADEEPMRGNFEWVNRMPTL